MAAKIIILANQKGGAGKTNVAVHLAGSCVRHGYKTLLIDADPQGTATKWVSQAEEGAPHKIRVMGLAMAGQKIGQEVKQYVDDYDLIIADCPPAVDSPIPQVMLMIADLALVPVSRIRATCGQPPTCWKWRNAFRGPIRACKSASWLRTCAPISR